MTAINQKLFKEVSPAILDEINETLDAHISEINQHRPGLVISDLIDDKGLQYVDLVMEGGGVLGVALLGYISVLERLGIRFRGIGGTSAGSITALLLAASGPANQAKSDILMKALFSKDFSDFIDGDSDAKDFINTALNKPKEYEIQVLNKAAKEVRKWQLRLKAAQVVDNIQDDRGLNPGLAFQEWVGALLASFKVDTLDKLNTHLNQPIPNLQVRPQQGKAPEKVRSTTEGMRLVLVAADVTTETTAEFPEMAPLYWNNPGTINPALFVRASMSVPYFFHPFKVDNIPNIGPNLLDQWEQWSRFRWQGLESIPKSITFVDGGIMSNFPINLFHQPKAIPQSPTFGVKLGLDNVVHETDGPVKLFWAIFNSARNALDNNFIKNNADYEKLVKCIPINEKIYNWLDFNMGDDQKKELFLIGAQAAKDFLLGFDWTAYKALRGTIANANAAAQAPNIQLTPAP